MQISPVKRTTISEQIFEQLKSQIVKGKLRPGDKLPSENQLCKMYGVSRTTIRQALANLASLDLIETRFGEGSYVKEVSILSVMNSLLTKYHLSEGTVIDLIEYRQLVEPSVTKRACEKATSDDIEDLWSIYRQMVAYQDNLERFAQLDCSFHKAIAAICGNPYIIQASVFFMDVLSESFSDIVLKRGNSAGLKYHKLIVEAFESHDAQKAYDLMKEHMDDMRADYE